MGTRNLTMVVHQGKTVIAQYGQWDGYPDGQGRTALNFLLSMDRTKFQEQLNKCRFMDEAKEKEVAEFLCRITGNDDGWMTMEQAQSYHKEYPLLTRDNGAGILQLVYDTPEEIIWLNNQEEFAADGLSNEWTYVIDLDKNVFEVYEGFSKTPVPEGSRFYDLVTIKALRDQDEMTAWEANPEGKRPYRSENKYNLEHVVTYKLDELPNVDEFLEFFERRQKD